MGVFVMALVSFSGVAAAASGASSDDCKPCNGTIVYNGDSCFCYEKLPLMLSALEPIDGDDDVQWQIGLTFDGFGVCSPEDELLGHIEVEDGWAEVLGEWEALEYWASLNE